MPKCECKYCLNLSNGKGRVLHRTTVARHLLEEKEAQALEDEYQRLHPEENLYHSEEENLNEENLREEDFFQNKENEKTNNYENDHYYYYENDDSISDSQNESESDNINSNADNEEDNTIISDELLEGLKLLYVKSNFNFSEAAFNNIYKAFNRNKMSLNKIKKYLVR
ncbi:unnamed protein product [Rhizophagus irregularis]|uniref:Uncharacterized protein n=1 Tax=Rhizophagus irregularis TaxID=588596 RepID=A0A916EL13_9GLOM|nr:unnamed protein product [Rhizophagus irregularis]